MNETLRVGFVGLGDMGEPMVRHIIAAGFQTTLWARRPASLARLSDSTFKVAGDLVDLGRSSDICGVCVFSDEDTLEVTLGDKGVLAGMRKGATLLLHPTIAPETAMRISEAGAARGVAVLDAPVAGTRVRAEEGTLSVMVGGASAAFEHALPVLRAYDRDIRHMGPIGSGMRMKALNNLLSRVNLGMAYEALEIGVKLGMERSAVLETLRGSGAASFMLEFLAERVLPDPEYARHLASMSAKDMTLFEQVRVAAGLERTPLEDAAEHGVRAFGRMGGDSGA